MKIYTTTRVCTSIGILGIIMAAVAQSQGGGGYPPGTTPYKLKVPLGLPAPSIPSDNLLTVEGVGLGQRLFNEKLLSGNNTLACSGCHHLPDAFSDEGKAVSTGITGQKGTRNAMTLTNLAYQHPFFWDGRAPSLRVQALAPIQNPVEMDQTLATAISNLKKNPQYPALFAKAFGSPGITADRIGLAIEQYEMTLLSGNSKYDLVRAGLAKFTPQEQQGFNVYNTPYNPKKNQFGGDCARCHGGPLFSDFKFRNNGLDSNPTDPGREDVTGLASDFAQFKTPSLRNLTVTGPFMHDGRFTTLDEVVDHYSNGIKQSTTIDPGLAKQNGGVHLSSADHDALVAFLKTLVDSAYTGSANP